MNCTQTVEFKHLPFEERLARVKLCRRIQATPKLSQAQKDLTFYYILDNPRFDFGRSEIERRDHIDYLMRGIKAVIEARLWDIFLSAYAKRK